jgi:hypothetical protein
VIAAKAVAFKLAVEPPFRERQQRTLQGAQIIAERLLRDDVAAAGVSVVSGGTDIHPTRRGSDPDCASSAFPNSAYDTSVRRLWPRGASHR